MKRDKEMETDKLVASLPGLAYKDNYLQNNNNNNINQNSNMVIFRNWIPTNDYYKVRI